MKHIKNNIASCAIWLWNMVSYVKGGIWKQDPEANILAWEWGMEKALQWGTSVICTVHLI